LTIPTEWGILKEKYHAHQSQIDGKVDDFPLMIQFKKRDLPNVAPLFFLRSTRAANGRPCFEAMITEGDAVLDILKAIIG
jgi:hypothetical protein